MNRDVTIYDLAKALKLSPATISRGLNNNVRISKSTIKKIHKKAKELGYRQNNFASNLRRKKTNTLGVIIHEFNSSFITSVLTGIEKTATQAGYDLIITHSSEDKDKERSNALNLFHKRVDGVLVSLSLDTENLNHFSIFEEKNIPIIFFDRVDEESSFTKVIIDNYAAGYIATQHLIEQGCKKVVLVTANLKRNVYFQRYRGYKDALKVKRIPFKKEYVIVKDLSEKCGREAAFEILKMKPRPDGIFVTNDFSAVICMQTLIENGIKIPEDICVVGFNNDIISNVIEPKLTTINYSGQIVGEVSAKILINHLKGITNIKTIPTTIVQSELIIRASSKRY